MNPPITNKALPKRSLSLAADKLRGTSGETMAEVMIAILIALLAATMLAMMVTAAMSTSRSSQAAMDALYDSELSVASKSSGKPGTATIDFGDVESEPIKVLVYEKGDSVIYEEDASNP